MGTDIHLYVEEKRGAEWMYEAGELFVWRSYDVFSRLCGVREQKPWHGISRDPRGFPESVSKEVREALTDVDIHSVSWISGDEFLREFPWDKTVMEMPHFAVVCYAYMWRSIRSIYPVRFVFGFDC